MPPCTSSPALLFPQQSHRARSNRVRLTRRSRSFASTAARFASSPGFSALGVALDPSARCFDVLRTRSVRRSQSPLAREPLGRINACDRPERIRRGHVQSPEGDCGPCSKAEDESGTIDVPLDDWSEPDRSSTFLTLWPGAAREVTSRDDGCTSNCSRRASTVRSVPHSPASVGAGRLGHC
jgi:hypothetical protein